MKCLLKSTQHHKSQQAEADQKKTTVKSPFMKCFGSVCAFAMVISQICLLASMMLAIVLYKEILFRWQVSMCIISAYKQFISLVKYSPKGHVPLVSYPIYGQFVLKPPTRIQHFLLIPSSENFHYSTPPPPYPPDDIIWVKPQFSCPRSSLMLIAQFSFLKLGSVYSVQCSPQESFFHMLYQNSNMG